MMRYKYKKITTCCVAFGTLLTLGTTAFAASDAEYTKNENIYVRLRQDGSVDGTYVVNSFQVTKEGEITDYGDYSTVRNLTNTEKIETDKREHTFFAEEGKFYYQGDITNAILPWKFDITYFLDGDEAEEEELAGAEGDLEIHMKIQKNPALMDETFFKGYLLQTSFTLDPELCDNIQAEGAVVSDAGSNENITYIMNPGAEAEIVIKAEVTDFEMDDIIINASPAGDMPFSFVEADNTKFGKATFAISAEGVAIPEQEQNEAVEADEGFLNKLRNLFKNLTR